MENYIRTDILSDLSKLLEKEKIILITGARQIGKTTVMLQLSRVLQGQQKKVVYISFEDISRIRLEQMDEKRVFFQFLLLEYGLTPSEECVLLLDEIQYLPDPNRLLKSLYDDTNLPWKIIATGSRFIGQKMVGSSLVGRGAIYPMTTLSFLEFLEIRTEFDRRHISGLEGTILTPLFSELLREYRIYGGYPGVIFTESIIDKKQAIIRIIDRIFLQDLPFFLSGDDVVPTKKIFQWIAENTGNLINIEAIASLFHLSAKQIHRSIEFLRSSYLIYDVAPYFRDKSREYSSRSKLYLHDVSLLSYTRNIWDDTFMTDGKITETLVVHALEKTLREGDTLHYYKKKTGSEIDFVIDRVMLGSCDLIEAKSGDKTRIPSIFESFRAEYPTGRALVTTRSIRETRSGVEFLPYWLVDGILTLLR